MTRLAPSRIYLDYAATAPIAAEVRAAWADAAGRWANPASVHAEGRAARAAFEDARAEVAARLGAKGTLIFTSGASEALRIVLHRARSRSRIVSAVEHRAVLAAAGADAIRVPVTPEGLIDLGALQATLNTAPAPALVALMQANNETGAIQPIEAAAELVHRAGGLLLVDAAQAAGKLAWPERADFIAVSAHKLGGPPGVGALIVRDLATLEADGGGHEGGYRMGTQDLPGAVGFAAALAARDADHDWQGRVTALGARLEARLLAEGAEIAAAAAPRLPGLICARMPGVEAMRQLMVLDLEGFAVSAGAACSSGTVSRSHVLEAMGWGDGAGGAIRVSLGWGTTDAEIDAFAAAWEAAYARLGRHAAPEKRAA